MATINVNGTPLQPAIDAAQPGDILVPKAGGYAGRLKITKSISIKGDGGAIIDGGTGNGSNTVNIDVAAKAVGLSGLDLRHGGYAVRFIGDCTGSIVENNSIPVVDWMYRTNSTADTGGNAFVFEQLAKGVEVRFNQIRKCRAASTQYGVDGGAFELYGGSSNLWIHHNEVWDCVNVAEGGKSSGDPDNADITIEDNIFHGRANPLAVPITGLVPTNNLANGMYLRAMNRLIVRRNVFDQVDYWAVLFNTGGTYGGGFASVAVTDNIFRLTPGSNRMVYSTGIPLSAFTIDANKVYATDATTVVAEVNGKKYLGSALAAFRTDTSFEKTSTWTVGALPPLPVPVPPQPVDPCLAVKAERDAALAQVATLTAQVSTVTAERDANAAKLAADKVDAAKIVAR